MHVVVIGAAGFVGRAVVERLISGALGPLSSLTLSDLRCPPCAAATRIVEGNYAEEATRDEIFATQIDVIFHVASLAGGAAEQDFARGRAANLDGTIALFDAAAASGRSPRIIYTSSIAALDMSRPRIDADTPLRPNGTYGTHKAMAELYLADLTRRGAVDGRSVRPSGVVARPPGAYAGFATWWMSDLFRAARADRAIELPVRADSLIWLQSIARTADNIIHAASMPAAGLPLHRSWTLPATVISLTEIAAALQARLGRPPKFTFGDRASHLPPLDSSEAFALGFTHDGDATALVARVMDQLEDEDK